MLDRWGYRLAYALSRKPSKAPLRALSEQCCLHDASYIRVLELQAYRRKDILTVLAAFMDPSDATTLESDEKMAGNQMGEAILYRRGAFPRGVLGPVRYMWRPRGREEGKGSEWHVWIWAHPAFANRLKEELEEATGGEGGREGGRENGKRMKIKLVPDLLLFEVRGPLSQRSIEMTCRPAFPFHATTGNGLGGEEEEVAVEEARKESEQGGKERGDKKEEEEEEEGGGEEEEEEKETEAEKELKGEKVKR
ncbi:hypothetical protein NSK_003704 [Nannochloropsis salina CCMP1776]|uniref:Uncharacterized protein n=1 Tax=Nannochloropsis salina CCMP1776 TaxID=1027361 RepID=A0A4D9D0S8_9STRA|nr:hypothetical protein NSK_003704 [Nannochloropsis salina CCMP1776]|eukprot:TFJ85281.1 hypothetical protein NSK_003704 [Nannochloropsis salina CCMP1776]